MYIKNKETVRFITATAIFDGHDASIQIIRRFLHESGAEVIHLGHNRSAEEVIKAAIQEDAHAIAISSYQGGHVEYLTYLISLLKKYNLLNIKIFAGGGGVITSEEISLLEGLGVAKIFTPEEGMTMGFSKMIEYMIEQCIPKDYNDYADDLKLLEDFNTNNISKHILASSLVTMVERKIYDPEIIKLKKFIKDVCINDGKASLDIPIIGFTGPGGCGKSSLIDEIILRFTKIYPGKEIAVLSIDPTRKKTGGALLGDRIRINSLTNKNVFFRSVATRLTNQSAHESIKNIINSLKCLNFDAIIIETAGIGQSDTEITNFSDICTYVMTSEYGASSQLEKIAMFDYANAVVLNKSDKVDAKDAFKDIQKVYRNIHKLFDVPSQKLPIFLTNTRNFNNLGIHKLFTYIFSYIKVENKHDLWNKQVHENKISILYSSNYLKYIIDTIKNYKKNLSKSLNNIRLAQSFYNILRSTSNKLDQTVLKLLKDRYSLVKNTLKKRDKKIIKNYEQLKDIYKKDSQSYNVRDKTIVIKNYIKTISNTKIPKVIIPRLYYWSDIVKFFKMENLPGFFPYTGGVFSFKREEEVTTRMFAGEGIAEKTNTRFHYLSQNQSYARLSTAFDSVTLYGSDPDEKLDIYGKIGNSGVSICTLDDMKRLYSGFDLCSPSTSVSMTINGPSPIILAYFFNAAVDFECEKYLKSHGEWANTEKKISDWLSKNGLEVPKYRTEFPKNHNRLGLGFLGVSSDNIIDKDLYEKIKKHVLHRVRGTIQADILKEDQAQNTCIFSIEFALRLMVDMQKFFIEQNIKNFYSVSVSGYHIAEAGANPITQLAFTLANGFTLAEYYIAQGLNINDFVKNFSFFFSNGLDIEYNVIGRVARRIWAISMKYLYRANERGQKLKYHIQTSGRSLHAQEMDFNDIRTTLQGYTAITDNCNSLHTNAYDEALTTPTENSVRRALAIQMIINKEFGIIQNQNSLQGSYVIDWLTNYVENKVLDVFDSLNERNGVLGSMDTLYQRNRIQEESMKYEYYKHTGKLPIIGVNSFVGKNIESPDLEISRSSTLEKNMQVEQVRKTKSSLKDIQDKLIKNIQVHALENRDIFPCLFEACKYCTLGQITQSLYEVGGYYRRSI